MSDEPYEFDFSDTNYPTTAQINYAESLVERLRKAGKRNEALSYGAEIQQCVVRSQMSTLIDEMKRILNGA